MNKREEWERAIAALEAQRATLGDEVVDAMIAAARNKMASLETPPPIPPTTEQRKPVTVLFADITGFTELAATMDPEEVRDTANILWERLDAVITAHGGTIDKHIGDAIIAFFGSPSAREDDPERAIRAALTMQAELHSLLEETKRTEKVEAPPLLQMHIGIHTSPVLLGKVGTRDIYTAVGDAVNLASRLQQAAPVGTILISHDTYRHVRGVFDVQPREPLSVKGQSEPIQVYVVIRAKPRAFRSISRGVEGIETRMIGREAELQSLREALDTVIKTGRMQAITIVGGVGVGKSRLLYEFIDWIDWLPVPVRFFRGRTDPQMSQRPYDLIRDLFAFRFEIRETDPAAVAREKIVRGIVGFMGPEGVEKAHFIGHLIGFDFSDSPHLEGILDDARQIRDRALHYITQFFTAVAEERPVALFLEDIHWGDRGALDIIEHLMRIGGEIPLLMVLLARPLLYESRPSWGETLSHHTRMDLQPLSEQDSGLLVQEILRKALEIPPDLLDLIVSQAVGNPFYIEELIKVLIEDGVILKGEDVWQVRPERLEATRVPPTLTRVLQARLDRLPTLERETLQRASVVGRVFWNGAVAYIGETAKDVVQEALQRLGEKELIIERRAATFLGEREWIFKHALLREVTYESVLRRQRRIYHTQVAAWLIEQSGERMGEHAGLIAAHYEQAGEVALASEWYRRAGRQAQDTYAPETAVTYYQKALMFLPMVVEDSPSHAVRRVALYEGLGDALGRLGRYTEAAEAYTAMREMAEAARDAVAQARAWERLGWVQDSQGDYRAALESAERAVGWAGAAGAQAELAKALLRKGRAFLELGNAQAASALGQQALALSSEVDARREMGRSLNLLGAVHWILGQHEQAAYYMEKALALHRELGNWPGVASTLNDLALNAQLRGDHHAAVGLYQDALAIFRDIGHRDGEIACLSNLGGARVALEEYRAAEVHLRQVINRAEVGSWFLSETYSFLAEAYLGQEKLEEALIAARRALALGQEIEQQEFVGDAWRALGMVAAQCTEPIHMDDADRTKTYDAAACFAESVRVFTEMGAEGQQARTLRAWAQYELEWGDKARGTAMWKEAMEIFTRLGMALEVERMARFPPQIAEEPNG